MIGSIILKYILISILISLIFGITVLTNNITNKINRGKLINPYSFQLGSLLIFIVIWFFNKSKIEIFEVSRLVNWDNIVLMLITIIPTSVIVYWKNTDRTEKLFRLVDFLDGASMEIPQRLLVQNMFVILNVNTIIYGSMTLAIVLNSLIWVQFIIVQEFICGRKVTKKIMPEVIASIWFSIWVGILYSISGNIIVPMIAHGLERMVAHWLKVNLKEAIIKCLKKARNIVKLKRI
ncbi:hypothetical protein [Clostridium gasigenes]|nr:hypothetical protein [Clostridium gasigenes]MBB6621962.1 hypothetical protein [Clostridium gasigenes]MBU3090267.1 hypothetical protein [Clostridium gasigenes]